MPWSIICHTARAPRLFDPDGSTLDPTYTMRSVQVLLAVLLASILSGCASTNVPQVATNAPSAELNDRITADDDESNMRVFYVVSIDGVGVRNVVNASGTVWGRRIPYVVARRIEARPMKVLIRGSPYGSAPISELARRAAGNFPTIEGTVDFDPKPGRVYRVTGRLAVTGSAIWIEDFDTNERVTEEVATSGP